MSTTTRQLSTPRAPWKTAFEDQVNKMPSPEFVVSTLHPAPTESPVPHLPRARYCIYRGMWAELPENKHNEAPKNERIYESDLLTFTTDVRMEKVAELFATSLGHGDRSQSHGSGGGGPIEAVFWIRETQTQWRIRGTAFVVAPDIDGSGEESSGVRTVKSEVGSRMRVVQPGAEASWSWAKELTAHFGNCSPAMRGTWRNPPPGTKVRGVAPTGYELGQKIEDLNDEVARANFRVVVIKPDVVEEVDLTDPTTARRQRYTFVVESSGQESRWEQEELWP